MPFAAIFSVSRHLPPAGPPSVGWSKSSFGYCKESDPDSRRNTPDVGPGGGDDLQVLSDCKQKCFEDASCAGISHYSMGNPQGFAGSCFLAKTTCTPALPDNMNPGSPQWANWAATVPSCGGGGCSYYTLARGTTTYPSLPRALLPLPRSLFSRRPACARVCATCVRALW